MYIQVGYTYHRVGDSTSVLLSRAWRDQRGRVDLEMAGFSVRDSQAFVDALLNPKPVNDRLGDTVRRYREITGA